MLVRIAYRIRQYWWTFSSAPNETDLAMVRVILPPSLQALFSRMTTDEQAHAVRVCRRLLLEGHTEPALLQAALLHDVGKAGYAPLRPWERALIVVCKALCPHAVSRWGQGEPQGWRRPFVVALQHPLWGAREAQRAGASPEATALIRYHQDETSSVPPRTPVIRFLAALQAADDAS